MAQGPTTPYLGSRISLISKSEIRYEGILYTVDTKESTIALAKVKSFGTEDRPTEHPVAPRDEVYEYIIFKASDIKDLMVRETPKPVPQLCPGLPYDPAIVSVSQQPGSLAPSMAPGGPVYHAGARAVGASASSSRTGTPDQGRGASPPRESSRGNKAVGSGNRRPQNEYVRPRGARSAHNVHHRQPMHHMPRGGQPFSGNYRAALVGARGMGGGPIRHPYRGNRGGGGGPGGPRAPGSNSQPRLKFDEEYDFEKSEEQFKEILKALPDNLQAKAKIEEGEEICVEKGDSGNETHEADSEEDKATFYDKGSSFFDNISCEALERQQQQEGNGTRPNWRKERQTNTETFGQSAVRHLAYRRGMQRGGGGYYRPRGRGYYNPRGGYNNQRY